MTLVFLVYVRLKRKRIVSEHVIQIPLICEQKSGADNFKLDKTLHSNMRMITEIHQKLLLNGKSNPK